MLNTAINILIPNGVNNTKIYKKPNSSIRCFDIPRKDIKNLAMYEYLDNYSGIYFLFGENHVYIGKSSSLINRIQQHNKDNEKEFFNRVVAFTTETNILTETYIDYLEYDFINKIDRSSQYDLVNKDKRLREPNITDFEKPTLMELYDEIVMLLEVIDIHLFTDIEKSTVDEIFYISNVIISAQAVYIGKEIEILKGSSGKIPDANDVISRKSRLYNKWLSNGNILANTDGTFSVIKNIVTSPSGGACLILSRDAINGWDTWKNSQNKTLNELFRSDAF